MANNATTFKQARAENYLAIFLNVDHFAETFAYIPVGGSRRTVIGNVDRGPAALREKMDSQEEFEEITVSCSKDPNAAADGILYSGIAAPSIGDMVILEGDTDDKAYVYVMTAKQTPYSHLLRFQRSKTQQLGTAQTRR